MMKINVNEKGEVVVDMEIPPADAEAIANSLVSAMCQAGSYESANDITDRNYYLSMVLRKFIPDEEDYERLKKKPL